MKYDQNADISWAATAIFYVVLAGIITALDIINNVFSWSYWAVQLGLVSLGVLILVLVSRKLPDISAQRGGLLAFAVGILTIIPGVMMSLNPKGEFWEQYFTVALSMAAGSFLGFLFLKLVNQRM